jgi:hypothetical protein
MYYPATANARLVAAAAGHSPDDGQCLDLAPNSVLAAIVRGEIDILAIARETLAARGFDSSERWVGFAAAERALLGR